MIGPLDPEEEIREAMERAVQAANNQAQDDFFGLSPHQVHRLIRHKWNEPGAAIQFRSDLPEEAFAGAELLHDVRALVGLIAEGSFRATKKGNLPRKLVTAMLENPTFESWKASYIGSKSAVNEEDVYRVHLARIIADFAGLIQLRSGVWRVVKKRQKLLEPERSNECFVRLMTIMYTKFNVGYRSWLEDFDVQHCIGYSLAQLRHWQDWTEWNAGSARRLLLPAIHHQYPLPDPNEKYARDDAEILASSRIIEPLRRLGLIEIKEEKWRLSAARTSPLFESLIEFDL